MFKIVQNGSKLFKNVQDQKFIQKEVSRPAFFRWVNEHIHLIDKNTLILNEIILLYKKVNFQNFIYFKKCIFSTQGGCVFFFKN